MTYCYSKEPIACIKYTGENKQKVLAFLELHTWYDDGLGLFKKANIGSWFVKDDYEAGDGVLLYKDEKDFLDAYGLLEEE